MNSIKNTLIEDYDIDINDIVIKCAICKNNVILFQVRCESCLSTGFCNYKYLYLDYHIQGAREWKRQQIRRFPGGCGTGEMEYRGRLREFRAGESFKIGKKRVMYERFAEIRQRFFNLPKEERNKTYNHFLNKFLKDVRSSKFFRDF
jgi:hypothetical protein